MDIGAASSIATLILFSFYFIGRTWTLFKNVKYPLEGIDAEVLCQDEFDDFSIDLGGTQVIKFEAQENLTYFEVWNCSWSDDFRSIKLNGRVSERLCNVPKGNAIYVRCEIPEGIPHNAIVFQRYDGLKGIFTIGYDGRTNSNGVSFGCNKLSVTFKAIVYNLVK